MTCWHRQQAGRLWRLVLKELREILRDRRTIITLVVMPILIYPLLAVVFQRFLVTSLAVTQNVSYVIGVESCHRSANVGSANAGWRNGLTDRQKGASAESAGTTKAGLTGTAAEKRLRGELNAKRRRRVTLVAYPDENLSDTLRIPRCIWRPCIVDRRLDRR